MKQSQEGADMEKFVLGWLLGVPLLMLVVLQYFL